MYYPPQPPPGYVVQPSGPRYSGCLKFILYAASVLVPIAGIIIAIVFMSKGDPESTSLGKICLVISIVVTVIYCCLGSIFGLLPVVMGFVQQGY